MRLHLFKIFGGKLTIFLTALFHVISVWFQLWLHYHSACALCYKVIWLLLLLLLSQGWVQWIRLLLAQLSGRPRVCVCWCELCFSLFRLHTSTKHDVQYTREHLAKVLKEIHWVARVTDKILLIRGNVKRKTWISASIKSNFDVLKYSTKIKKQNNNPKTYT